MDPLQLGGTLGTAAAASWAGWEAFRSRREAALAAGHASRAADLSSPTGNGFAGRMEGGIGNLEDMIREFRDETRADLESLVARVDRHRSETRSDIERVEEKVDRHLGDHAAADVAGRRRS